MSGINFRTMKRLLVPLLILTLSSSFKSGADAVYICDNKTSEVYHVTKSCNALDRCKHEVITVTKEEAEKKYEKRACKVCIRKGL